MSLHRHPTGDQGGRPPTWALVMLLLGAVALLVGLVAGLVVVLVPGLEAAMVAGIAAAGFTLMFGLGLVAIVYQRGV